MKVTELTREQLDELKRRDLTRQRDEEGEGVSYYELACAPELISDEAMFEEYADVYFTNDDFFCTAGMEEAE